MKEGDVVMVAGKLDDRVRDNDHENRTGTVIQKTTDYILVLLENGDIWKGPEHHAFPIEEQS